MDFGHDKTQESGFEGRRIVVLALLLLAMLSLVIKAVYLQVVDKPFLQKRALQQYSDIVSVPAYRGQIKDRQGESLAISTPVQAVILKPNKVEDWRKVEKIAGLLGVSPRRIRSIQKHSANKSFIYLKR